jgi:hypothetical protein
VHHGFDIVGSLFAAVLVLFVCIAAAAPEEKPREKPKSLFPDEGRAEGSRDL